MMERMECKNDRPWPEAAAMSDQPRTSVTERPALVLAQFAGPKELIMAAKKTRGAGYKKFDCHSPFPIHGMDQAMGEKQSPLGWIVGGLALIGGTGALLMQWWMSAIDYPVIISGKAFFSFQAFVPITFELTVLLSAFGAVFGMFALNGLPRLHHPIFNSDRFAAASNNGFFLSVEAADAKFDPLQTTSFLESIGGEHVETLSEEVHDD